MNMKPGEHLCCLYDTEEERRAGLMGFLQQGLEQGEKVVCIVDTHTADTTLGYLQAPSTSSGQAPSTSSGQALSTITCDETYMREGVLNPAAMIALLRAETEQALAEGHSALRAVVEMSWTRRTLPGSKLLIEYEARLNQFVPGTKCLLLCHYDRRHFNQEVLLDVLRIHPIRIVGTIRYDDFVSQDTLQNTTECTKGFSCLRAEGAYLCEVETAIGNKVLFVACAEPCRYRMSFGASMMCTCPTRKEIHSRYRI